jgi:hypothetical protein
MVTAVTKITHQSLNQATVFCYFVLLVSRLSCESLRYEEGTIVRQILDVGNSRGVKYRGSTSGATQEQRRSVINKKAG